MQAVISIGFLLGLTSSLAIVLAIANSKWKVFEDPRIDDVQHAVSKWNEIAEDVRVDPKQRDVIRSTLRLETFK